MGRVCAGIEPDSLAAKNDYATPPLGCDEVSHIYGILYNGSKAKNEKGLFTTANRQ